MKIYLIIAVAALAATSASARDPKPKKEAPPPPPAPVVEYENDDPQMGEALESACLAAPAEQETYDSRDNLLITRIECGRAMFHFKSGCDTTTMMFADSIRSADGSQCVKPGGYLAFTSSYGDVKKCEVARINRWLDEELISPEDQ